MMVVYSWSEVETSALVLTTAVVRADDVTAALVLAAALAFEVVACEFAPVVVADAAGVVVVAVVSVVGAVVGSVVGVGVGVAAGVVDTAADDTGRVDVVGAAELAGVVEPVPAACRLTPWWRYSSMPSRWRSSRLKADEKAASAKSATKSHSFCSMFGDV